MKKSFSIGGRQVGGGAPLLFIAEAGVSHFGDMKLALELVHMAAEARADVFKTQFYDVDAMIASRASDWKERLRPRNLTLDQFAELKALCDAKGMLFMSTAHSESRIPWLEKLDVPAIKVGSGERNNPAFLERLARLGKPMIVSTGMATLAELDELVSTARAAGCRDLVLLKCTSTYPASPENSNLRTIEHLRATFGCEVGLSDHTLGTGVAVAAVALGATVIEKHFTLSRADGGVDSTFSMEPDELTRLVEDTEKAWRALGSVHYGPTAAERASTIFRRSIYAVADIAAGERLTADNVRCIRPGAGLPPKYYELVLGRPARTAIRRGTPLSWELI